MSSPTPVATQTRDTQETFKGWIDEVLVQFYSDYFVTLDKDFPVTETASFPLIVIDDNMNDLEDNIYGRELGGYTGSNVFYVFTLYVYCRENADNNYDRDIQILIRRIVDWLRKKHQNATMMSEHGIWSVTVGEGRESNPQIRGVTRIIINVAVQILRKDG